MSTHSVKKKRIGSRRRVPNQNERDEFHAADTPSLVEEENAEILVEVVHANDSQSVSQHLPSPETGYRRKLGSSRRNKGRQYVRGDVTESSSDPHEENASGNEILNAPAIPTMMATVRQEESSQKSENEFISVAHHIIYPSTSSDFSSEVQNPNKTNIPKAGQNLLIHLDEKDNCKQDCCETTPEEMNKAEALWSEHNDQIPQSVHNYGVSSLTSFSEHPCSQTDQHLSDPSQAVHMPQEELANSVLVDKEQADAKLMSGNVQDNSLVIGLQIKAEDKVSCIMSVEIAEANTPREPVEPESFEQATFAQSEEVPMNEKHSEHDGVREVTGDHQPEDPVNKMHELESVSARTQEMHQTQNSGFVMHGAKDTSDFVNLLEIGESMSAPDSELNVNDLTAGGEYSISKELNDRPTDESNVDILTQRNDNYVCDSEGLPINNSGLVEAETVQVCEAEVKVVDDLKCSYEQPVHGKTESLVSGVEDDEYSLQTLQLEINVPLNSQPQDDSESVEQQTDTDFKPAGEMSSNEGHHQCHKENSENTSEEDTLVLQNTTGNVIVAAEITSSLDKDHFLKLTDDVGVVENVGIQTKEPENFSQLVEHETFTSELMQSPEASCFLNMSDDGEEVNSVTSTVDVLYQETGSPTAPDQDMDMKQGGDVETTEAAIVKNLTANYDKDPTSLVDSVSGQDEVGEKCDVPAKEDSAATEIDATQENINVILVSVTESDSFAPFHEENSKVLAEQTADVCEENGTPNAADGHKNQRDTLEERQFTDDDLHTNTKQKRRKMGSTRRIKPHKEQEGGMDNSDPTKEGNLQTEAEERNESFCGAEMGKPVEFKSKENNLHQVLEERDVDSVVTDMTHTSTQLIIVRENSSDTDNKMTEHTTLAEAAAHEEVSESTTCQSAVINMIDNKETIDTEEKTSGRTSPDSTQSQISQKDTGEAEETLNEQTSAQSVKNKRIDSHRGAPNENKQGDADDEFHVADTPSLLQGYVQEENTEISVEVVPTNESHSATHHPPSLEATGNRRKLGSSRRNKGRKYVKDYVAESWSEPSEEPVENTSGNDILNAPAVVTTVRQELQESSLTSFSEHPCSQTDQHLSDPSQAVHMPQEELANSVLVDKEQADAKLMSGNVQDNRLVIGLQIKAEDKVSCIMSVETAEENTPGEPAEPENVEQATFAQSEEVPMNEKQSEHDGVREVTGDHQPEDPVNKMHELETVSARTQEMHQTQNSGFVMHGAKDTSDFVNLLEIGESMSAPDSELNVNDLTAGGEYSISKELNDRPTDESNVDILTQRNDNYVCDSEGLPINNSGLVEAETVQVCEAEVKVVDDLKCSYEQPVHGKTESLVSGVEDDEYSLQTLQLEINVPLNSQPQDDSESVEQQTDTDFKPAGEMSSNEGHHQCHKENSENTSEEDTLVLQNTTGNVIVAAEITSSLDKDHFLKSTDDVGVEENVGIQTKEPENFSQLVEHETFTSELMQSPEASCFLNMSDDGEEVNSVTSTVDVLYQETGSPTAPDQDMDMKQGGDIETTEAAIVKNLTANYDKDPTSLVDSVSGQDEVGEKCDVPAKEDSAATEIDATQENINVILVSVTESDSFAPFHEENSKVLAEQTADVCEENGTPNAADGHKNQRDTLEERQFTDDDLHTNTKQKRRKMGSTRRIKPHKEQEGGMDNSDPTKEGNLQTEAEERNERFCGAEMGKPVEFKSKENNLHQVLEERDVDSVVTDVTHTSTQLINFKENSSDTDNKMTEHTTLAEAAAHEEVSESTTCQSAVINMIDNKETIDTEEKTSGRTSPDSTQSQISQKDTGEAEETLNEQTSAQSVKNKRIDSHRGAPNENKQGDADDEFHVADTPSLLQGYVQEENTEISVEVVPTNESHSATHHPPSLEATGNRRKLGSSRRNKGRKYVKDYVAESWSEPSEEPVENTSGNDILNAPAVVTTVRQELQESSLTSFSEHPCSQTDQHLSDPSQAVHMPQEELANSVLVDKEQVDAKLMSGNVQDNRLVIGLQIKAEDKVSCIMSVDIAEANTPGEPAEPESVEQATFVQSEEVPMNEKQSEHDGVREVTGDHQPEDPVNKMHELETVSARTQEMHQTQNSGFVMHGVEENVGIQTKEPENLSQLVEHETFMTELMQSLEDSCFQDMSDDGGEVNSVTSTVDVLYQETGSSTAPDQDMDMKQGGDVETTEAAIVKNLTANYDKDPTSLVDSVSGQDEVGEKCDVPAKEDSAATEIDATQENINVILVSVTESDSFAPFHEENSKVLAEQTADVCEENGTPNAADGHKNQRDTLEERQFTDDDLHTNTKQKRRKMGSTRRIKPHKEQEGGMDNSDPTKEGDLQTEAEERNESFCGAEMEKPVEFKSKENNLHQVLEERDVDIVMTDVTHTSTQLINFKENSSDTDNKMTEHTTLAEAAAHEEVSESTTCQSAVINMKDNKETIDTEEKTSGRTSPDSTQSQINRNDMSEGAHNTNTSQDSNAASRRRKMGSTRKNFGSRAKVENLHQKQEMVAETSTSEREVIENISIDKEEQLQDQPQHEVCDPEQEKAKAFQTVERSLTCDNVTLVACQSAEEIPVCRNDFPSETPDSSAQDFQSESTSGRRRKMGSHRKTHGHQYSENLSACEDKRTGDRNGRRVKSTTDAAAIQTSKGEREESLNKITEVNEDDIRPSCNISSSEAGVDLRSEKAPGHVTVQQPRPEVHLVSKTESRHSLAGNTKGTDVTPKCYNVFMVGNSGVGKTCFVKRAQTGEFSLDVAASVGVDLCVVTVNVNGEAVVLRLWDTGGQERFHSITRQMFYKAQAFLLMYDVTSTDSFSAARYWLTCIQEGAAENVIVLLLGNKSDCAKRRVHSQEGETLAKEYKFDFMECSAATGENVLHSLETLARMLSQNIDPKEKAMPLHEEPQQRRTLGCC